MTLCIVSSEDEKENEIKTDLSRMGPPRWSPDGKSVAIHGTDPKGVVSIHLISLTTHERTPLRPGEGGINQPDWFPDGKEILYWKYPAYLKDPKEAGLYIFNLEKKESRKISDMWGPGRISPDGKKIMVGGSKLSIIPVSGGTATTLVDSGSVATQYSGACWSPDGNKIAFRFK